jgi:F0F1-type ATP synthase membrane subunit c/vacuolar-type H+-ATPase subunit K
MIDLPYLLGSLGIMAILGLSAYGSCYGMMKCGASSIIHSQIGTVLTYSYVAMIMISTSFFYGFILAIIIINKLDPEYTLHKGIHHLTSGLIFGGIGLSSGIAMGNISEKGFKKMAQNEDFYTSFMISLASVEVTLVIGFLSSLLVIYKVQ